AGIESLGGGRSPCVTQQGGFNVRRLPILTGILVAALALALAAGPAAAQTLKVGMVTDMGGVDDKSFNQGSWEGLVRAIRELGIHGRYLESQQQSDYARNILEFIDQDYDLIVTVGFLLGDATLHYAKQFPDQKFAIVDYSYDPPVENIRDILFATDEAAFLAGYLAAGMTQTGRQPDRKSTRLNSSHVKISYAVFCLKKKKRNEYG